MRRTRYSSSTLPARWQSGYAGACKAPYVGSIPARASIRLHAVPIYLRNRVRQARPRYRVAVTNGSGVFRPHNTILFFVDIMLAETHGTGGRGERSNREIVKRDKDDDRRNFVSGHGLRGRDCLHSHAGLVFRRVAGTGGAETGRARRRDLAQAN